MADRVKNNPELSPSWNKTEPTILLPISAPGFTPIPVPKPDDGNWKSKPEAD